MKKITEIPKMIAIILMLTIAMPLLALQPNVSVNAQTQYTNMQEGGSILLPSGATPDVRVTTSAHLSFRPSPVGVGQQVLVNIWTSPGLHISRYIKDYVVTIDKPDGTQETVKKDSYRADATAWFEYVPDQVGEYKLKFDFQGAYWPTGNYTVEPGGSTVPAQIVSFTQSVYHEPSASPEMTLVVQSEPVNSWPSSPIPTDYWTRPINPQNREWWIIAGNYPWRGVGGGPVWEELYPNTNPYWGERQRFTPWVQGPDSAHVVWKRQGAISGLIGGDLGTISLTRGGGNPNLIYEGRAYQSVTKELNGELKDAWQCYDIRTGEVLWERADIPANQRPTLIHYTEQALGRGAVPGSEAYKRGLDVDLVYVGGGRYITYDPWNGAVRQNISIAPLTTGTLYKDPFFLSVQNLGASVPLAQRYRLINWTITTEQAGVQFDYSYYFEVMHNITWPWANLGTAFDVESNVAVTAQKIEAQPGAAIATRVRAVSMTTGAELWDKTFDQEPLYSGSCVIAEHGKVAFLTSRGHFIGVDLYSGNTVWTSEKMDYPWDASGFGQYSIASAYGLFYYNAYANAYAFDWNTGKIAWRYEDPTLHPYDSAYISTDGGTVHSLRTSGWIADGKYYVANSEHTPPQPITRGWGLHCVNATTGERIWRTSIPGTVGPIADGYMSVSATNGYQYVFGKGRSQITVTAPTMEVQIGQKFVISGSVVDLSPAQPGTPAISDEDMGSWMEYLHAQFPKPTDAKGVPVVLTALDQNNNLIEIGIATTDTNGVFGFTWSPQVPGQYHVVATFAGSASYGSSSASTFFTAVDAPAIATPETPATQASVAEMYFVPAITGIIVVIVIGFALIALLLLKKRT